MGEAATLPVLTYERVNEISQCFRGTSFADVIDLLFSPVDNKENTLECTNMCPEKDSYMCVLMSSGALFFFFSLFTKNHRAAVGFSRLQFSNLRAPFFFT